MSQNTLEMRFRELISTLVILLVISSLQAQILDPIDWDISVSELKDGEVTVTFDATIEDHWHLYSQHMDPDKIGPIPTSFNFEENPAYSKVGETSEPTPIVDFDPNFDMELGFFEKEARFVQKLKVSEPGTRFVGMIEFMTCDDSKCIFPDPVSFDLGIGEQMSTAVAPTGGGHAQESGILQPVDWTWSSTNLGDGRYELLFHADIDPHWHLYSQHLESQFGPVPTSFTFETESTGVSLEGKTTEGTPLVSYDPNFEMDLSYYETSADFKQVIKVDGSNDGTVSGFLSFMVCDDSKCLPPEDIDFKIDLKTGKAVDLTIGSTDGARAPDEFKIATVDLDNPVQSCGAVETSTTDEGDSTGLWTLFLLGFGGGLIALLTPCVFPMIPLTVSFFTKGSKDRKTGIRNAFTYGFFIFLIYILLSVPFHLLDNLNPDILNEISTNVALNVFFFIIFLVFAFSFFGFYEITLPSSFTNKMDDKASSAGGMVGIFFMALTLALVSFSCTGPILGSLLAGSLTSDGGAIQLTAGMGGFGAALALPFALFAAFPGWMNSLPQSGGWLNSVKVVLGFAEVALAFKFLSNADLVAHWELIKIEPFLIVWILCSGGIALYLFGLIKFPHDSPIQKLSPMRIGLGVIAVAFTLYLASGFRFNEKTETFTSLELLSGLAPPVGHSFIHPKHCPNGLDCFHDYDKGMAYAKEVNKPVLIDFTGYACVNCRKMEEQVWPKPGVVEMIEGDYVLISLYVDDKEELAEADQVEVLTKSGQVRKLKTIGNKWSVLQTETFNNNAQPYYALLSPDGKLLTTPVGYTPDIEEYKSFLECGLKADEELRAQAALE